MSELSDHGADALTEQVDDFMRERAARMDRELHGAWRAGYDRLHVYDEVDDTAFGPDTPSATLSIARAVLPADEGDGRPAPDGYVYRHTFDLSSVPDDVIRRAVRGDIDPDEVDA